MDEKIEQCIVVLNIVRVKLLGRIAHHEAGNDTKEWQRDDLDRMTRAKDHVEAALSYLNQSEHISVEIKLELPF